MSYSDPTQAQLTRTFRHEKAKIVAGLVRLVGTLEGAEDCFSEALEVALKTWPEKGTPDNPAAWLNTVARRKGLDLLRKQKRQTWPLTAEVEEAPDDRLSLIFTCCHPALPLEARLALTLRTLGGLTTGEIAAAFLVPETTMAQRLVRAQKKIRESGIPYRVPPPELLQERLEGVLATLYLIFNESYWASQGDSLVRPDLCQEAITLTQLLVDLMPKEAEPLGLLALMHLQNSRSRARLNDAGEALTLEAQNRSLWNAALMQRGYQLLDQAMRLGRPGPYQVQAAIASMHCLAPSAEATDWGKILMLYDSLLAMTPGPVVALNRAVALAMARSPEEGLALLESLAEPLEAYAPFHAARADLLRRLQRPCRQAYEKALQREQNAASRRYLARRLQELPTEDSAPTTMTSAPATKPARKSKNW